MTIHPSPFIVQVLLPLFLDTPFDYAVPEGMMVGIGEYVLVPLGKSGKEVLGVVWGIGKKPPEGKTIKPVLQRFDAVPPMSEAMRKFLGWAAWYNVASLGMVLKLALSVPAAFTKPRTETVYAKSGGEGRGKLTDIRRDVLEALTDGPLATEALNSETGASRAVLNAMAKAGWLVKTEQPVLMATVLHSDPHTLPLTSEQQAAGAQLAGRVGRGFSATLLDGITGSGKTEVYFEAMAEALSQDKQVLVLLPEIGLSVQWLERCERRFGMKVAIWHSAIAPGTRKATWRGAADGSARLVVGARSALFLPYRDLGLIVVDEEHDGSYKQEEGVIYQGRDMAVARARIEEIPIVLVSATPSLETQVNAEEGKYAEIQLHRRHHGGALPEVIPIDLRRERMAANEWISAPLKEAISQALRDGQQTLLFLNRRGYAPLLLCRHCGHRFACPNCTAWLVWHRHSHSLQCHHCDHREPAPARCPTCHDPEHLAASGPGIERLEEEVLKYFPTVRLLTLSSETMQTPKDIARVIHQIERGEVDILIGTQLMAKGHHFPGLSLVGIVDGDLGLAGSDLRAGERTWQLLHQLAGRAGRGVTRGKVLLQTTQPEHPVMQALIRGDRQGFLALEKAARRRHGLPPYGRLAALIVESLNEERARETARNLGLTAPHAEDMPDGRLLVLGPSPAPLYRLRNKFRHRFLIQAPKSLPLQALLADWLARTKIPPNVAVRVDVDPQSFL